MHKFNMSHLISHEASYVCVRITERYISILYMISNISLTMALGSKHDMIIV